MTTSAFKTWLQASFPRGRGIDRAAFLAVARIFGPEITEATLNHWLSGRPLPDRVAGVPFEQFLDHVAKAKAEPVAALYTVTLAVDERTDTALKGIAKDGGIKVEQFLLTALQAQVEDEVEIFEASRKRRKR